ncbi:hypothetical protein PAXRUDRAFT_726229 [Paxillus rubicundulus Ve08.2h10]|uniref:Uncharacterized protein n=1 Tax=Paxillus rubicundulus Ve08.2h10 TaxID=930991 RepID=A0A0D0D2A1_9AGAM|nr:hypothetical protein PAXRUDRAFT_726229 [Paxillus rubicundulus Ve08.2h10]
MRVCRSNTRQVVYNFQEKCSCSFASQGYNVPNNNPCSSRIPLLRVPTRKGKEYRPPMIPKRYEERTRVLGVIVATCMTFGCDSRRPSCTSSTAVCRLLCYHDEKSRNMAQR